MPVEGTVLFDGKPLTFGSVMFQPAGGPPARGKIQTDGSFRLTTYVEGDGVAAGPSRVRVTAYEGQDPSRSREEGEQPLGRLLIPARYTNYGTSGLAVEVAACAGQPVQLHLQEQLDDLPH